MDCTFLATDAFYFILLSIIKSMIAESIFVQYHLQLINGDRNDILTIEKPASEMFTL